MEILAILIVGAIVISAIPQRGRNMWKSFFSIFYSGVEKNPKVVAANYDLEIQQKQSDYNFLKAEHAKAVARQRENEDNIRMCEAEKEKLIQACITAKTQMDSMQNDPKLKEKLHEDAQHYALKAKSAERKLELYLQNREVFAQAVEKAEKTKKMALKALNALKESKDYNLTKAEIDRARIAIANSQDTDAIASDSARIIAEFEATVKKQGYIADGAEIVVQTSEAYQEIERQERQDAVEADSYIEDLMKSVKTGQTGQSSI